MLTVAPSGKTNSMVRFRNLLTAPHFMVTGSAPADEDVPNAMTIAGRTFLRYSTGSRFARILQAAETMQAWLINAQSEQATSLMNGVTSTCQQLQISLASVVDKSSAQDKAGRQQVVPRLACPYQQQLANRFRLV